MLEWSNLLQDVNMSGMQLFCCMSMPYLTIVGGFVHR